MYTGQDVERKALCLKIFLCAKGNRQTEFLLVSVHDSTRLVADC